MMSSLRVFVFSPNFGLPTSGPFALKLEAWLRMAGIDYERVYEDNPSKGPKGKNPWIELDDEEMGDTELIIEHLSNRHQVDLDAHLSTRQSAIALVIRRMVEEHLHQVLEWELFVHDAGWEAMAEHIDEHFPIVLNSLLKFYLRRHFKKQLHARGINRHDPETVARLGKKDLDALDELLADGGLYLFGDRPCVADASVFGLAGPFVHANIEAPVIQYAKTLPNLRTYCERLLSDLFPDWDPGEDPSLVEKGP